MESITEGSEKSENESQTTIFPAENPIFNQNDDYYGETVQDIIQTKIVKIPQSAAGVIIGRNGSCRSYIERSSGAIINVQQQANLESAVIDVQVTGDLNEIDKARKLIYDEVQKSDAITFGYEFTMQIPNHAVAHIVGKKGMTIKELQATTGARIQVIPLRLPEGDTSTHRKLKINGTTEQIMSARHAIENVIRKIEEEHFKQIPGYMVAHLVGKGGKTIKNLEAVSATRIQVMPPADTAAIYQTIKIKGTEENIQSAIQLINNLITELAFWDAFGC